MNTRVETSVTDKYFISNGHINISTQPHCKELSGSLKFAFEINTWDLITENKIFLEQQLSYFVLIIFYIFLFERPRFQLYLGNIYNLIVFGIGKNFLNSDTILVFSITI